MGKKSSDPADVRGAAQLEGEFGERQAQRQLYADRPNQSNFLGSLEWTPSYKRDPVTGSMVTTWDQVQSLSPEAKRVVNPLFDSFGDRAELMRSLEGRIGDEIGAAPDWEQFGDYQDLDFNPEELRGRAEDALYSKQTSRLDDRFSREGEALDIRLRSQGLSPGDQAYDSQMEGFNTGRNDAYEQASLSAIAGGRDEANSLFSQQLESSNFANALRDQKLSEYLGRRSFSLGESQRLSPLNDLTTIAGLITGEGLGGNSPDSGNSSGG